MTRRTRDPILLNRYDFIKTYLVIALLLRPSSRCGESLARFCTYCMNGKESYCFARSADEIVLGQSRGFYSISFKIKIVLLYLRKV